MAREDGGHQPGGITGADHIEVPGQSQNLGEANGNIQVSALIEEGAAIKWEGTKGTVTGTVKKDPDGLEGLYGPEEQVGHFFPVEFKPGYYGKNILVGSQGGVGGKLVAPTKADPYLIIRIENVTVADKISAIVKETREEVFELDFSGVTKAEV